MADCFGVDMPDTSAILDALHGIASRLDADMSEKDVENTFLNEDFYDLLGYEGAGHDLRSEWTLPDDRRPDYVTLDSNESVTAVSSRSLSKTQRRVMPPISKRHSENPSGTLPTRRASRRSSIASMKWNSTVNSDGNTSSRRSAWRRTVPSLIS
jgi:hypothetical protein